ncbi:MAG: hypothetical protein IJU94_06885 [Clostridia bacterium]|nr:hypothetical protein [Clostridia bacterium]
MKKLISFILLFCLCFTFAACGKNTPAPANSGTEPDSSSSGQSSEQSGGQQTETGEPKITSINLREKAGAESVYDMFDYGDGFVGVVIVKTVDGERKMFLRFIDTNYGRLADGEYELGGDDFVFTVDRGNSHYICFENSTFEVSGDPRTGVKLEPIEFRYSYERDDSRLYSPDGKWYATRDPDVTDKKGDATLVNVVTGEKITPYVGVNNGDFEDTTSSIPVGFAGDKFIFNIVGYEWLAGYGIYDLSTGETLIFDDKLDLGVFPARINETNRIPYEFDREEFGFIDLEAPDVRHPLYTKEKDSGSVYQETFEELLGGATYFTVSAAAGGKYLAVIAEDDGNGMIFAVYDFRTFDKICEHREDEYMNAYVFSGNAAVFMFESVDASRVVVVTLP